MSMNLSELTLTVMVAGDGRHEEAAASFFGPIKNSQLWELDDGLLVRITGGAISLRAARRNRNLILSLENAFDSSFGNAFESAISLERNSNH